MREGFQDLTPSVPLSFEGEGEEKIKWLTPFRVNLQDEPLRDSY